MALNKLAARRLVVPNDRTMTGSVTLIDGSSTPQQEDRDNSGKSQMASHGQNFMAGATGRSLTLISVFSVLSP
ncbi:hypothetical protein [Halomicronema sp. CCY15110]|uniref:hypothetical protein n=1 Tax=Halomicronema sp. CCY15110 TaxID=2767773 RepID=UPI00194E2335|nr:hypothetical protein [Halomicronema sp. CCY15110]